METPVSPTVWDRLAALNPPPRVRRALYGIGVAAGVLASSYGFVDDVTWGKWMGLFSAVLALAGANVPADAATSTGASA